MSIESNIKKIKDEITSICNDCGRNPEDVNLMAVTKTVDVDAVLEAIGDKVNWHLIGTLQTNKVKYIIDKVTMIHSLDREALCEEIQKRAEKIDRVIDCLVQVNISKEETKHGLYKDDVVKFIKMVSEKYKNIRIRGLMTMAPFVDDEEVIESVFKGLKDLSLEVESLGLENVYMNTLSMGMSHDYHIAIKNGATIVRVGTAIFGPRNYNN